MAYAYTVDKGGRRVRVKGGSSCRDPLNPDFVYDIFLVNH
jgi:hypothetical protein